VEDLQDIFGKSGIENWRCRISLENLVLKIGVDLAKRLRDDAEDINETIWGKTIYRLDKRQ